MAYQTALSIQENVRTTYFTAHHFVRDVLAPTATLTVSLLGALCLHFAALSGRTSTTLDALPEALQEELTIGDAAVLLTFFFIVAAALGRISLDTYLHARSLCRIVCRIAGKIFVSRGINPWDRMYRPHLKLLTSIYSEFIGTQRLARRKNYSRVYPIVETLLFFMRAYDPTGYAHIYRYYTFLDMARQLAVYSLVLALWRGAAGDWVGVLVLLSLLAFFLLTTRTLSERQVNVECRYIAATAAALRLQFSRASAET